MLSDRCLSVCLFVCLSATFVHCGQTVGRIKMKLGMDVGLGPSHIVLDGVPVPPKGPQPPIFGPCLLWQTTGWIKMPLGTEVDLGPGHIVLDRDPTSPKGGQEPPLFGPRLFWPIGCPSQLLLSTCLSISVHFCFALLGHIAVLCT